MSDSVTDKRPGLPDEPKAVFRCARRLIECHNKKLQKCIKPLEPLQADNTTTTDNVAVALTMFHIPDSKKFLGVDTSVLAVSVINNHQRSIALPMDTFTGAMKHLENLMTETAVEYTKDSVRKGYYRCMYHYGAVQYSWESLLDCHRTFLLHTEDVPQLYLRLASNDEQCIMKGRRDNWGRPIDRMPLRVRIPTHSLSSHR